VGWDALAGASGLYSEEPIFWATVGVNVESVESWKAAVAGGPFGLTVAVSVAPVAETETAGPVETVKKSPLTKGGYRGVLRRFDSAGRGLNAPPPCPPFVRGGTRCERARKGGGTCCEPPS